MNIKTTNAGAMAALLIVACGVDDRSTATMRVMAGLARGVSGPCLIGGLLKIRVSPTNKAGASPG